MKKELVLHQPWGGLGDNLQFSTLPRRLHKLNCEFNISNKNAYRNDEIKKIVWDINPFDQWGVELGKQIAKTTLQAIQQHQQHWSNYQQFDASTNGLLSYININSRASTNSIGTNKQQDDKTNMPDHSEDVTTTGLYLLRS